MRSSTVLFATAGCLAVVLSVPVNAQYFGNAGPGQMFGARGEGSMFGNDYADRVDRSPRRATGYERYEDFGGFERYDNPSYGGRRSPPGYERYEDFGGFERYDNRSYGARGDYRRFRYDDEYDNYNGYNDDRYDRYGREQAAGDSYSLGSGVATGLGGGGGVGSGVASGVAGDSYGSYYTSDW